jgi:Secretory lipase
MHWTVSAPHATSAKRMQAPTSWCGVTPGGHASLFTGQLAASYAPELQLLGVAAGAPTPNLKDLFATNIETTVGRILIAMALHSWARVYDDASLDEIVTQAARPLVDGIARNCLYNQKQILSSVTAALALDLAFLHTPPSETGHLQDARGQLCAQGETIDVRILTGTAHLDAGQVSVPDVVQWIADRFAGRPAPRPAASGARRRLDLPLAARAGDHSTLRRRRGPIEPA